MSVEKIYYEQIKSFEETINLIKEQITSSYQPLTRLGNIKQIIEQHEFIHAELYHKFNTTKLSDGCAK